jgi:hypothetical protein
MNAPTLELAVASTDIDAARDVARALNGTLYCDERDDWQTLPFRALVTTVTDDLDALTGIADVGTYVVCRRLIKPGQAGVLGLFPLVRRPGLSRRAGIRRQNVERRALESILFDPIHRALEYAHSIVIEAEHEAAVHEYRTDAALRLVENSPRARAFAFWHRSDCLR